MDEIDYLDLEDDELFDLALHNDELAILELYERELIDTCDEAELMDRGIIQYTSDDQNEYMKIAYSNGDLEDDYSEESFS